MSEPVSNMFVSDSISINATLFGNRQLFDEFLGGEHSIEQVRDFLYYDVGLKNKDSEAARRMVERFDTQFKAVGDAKENDIFIKGTTDIRTAMDYLFEKDLLLVYYTFTLTPQFYNLSEQLRIQQVHNSDYAKDSIDQLMPKIVQRLEECPYSKIVLFGPDMGNDHLHPYQQAKVAIERSMIKQVYKKFKNHNKIHFASRAKLEDVIQVIGENKFQDPAWHIAERFPYQI
jgi:hypothetical protein